MKRFSRFLFVFILVSTQLSVATFSQGVTMPPNGGNQKTTIVQQMGLAKVKITYSSPDVSGREGKIWGQLVPYGTTDFKAQGFGTSTEGPWRAGANENTVIFFSHDVNVAGKAVKAGTYGLHLIPKKEGEWTLILSNNSTQWGSYFYDPEEDALRVEVEVEDAPYREYLTYDFLKRGFDKGLVALHWENKRVKIPVEIPGMTDLYVENMRRELQSSAGFTYMGFMNAANFCLNNNIQLEQALDWASKAVDLPFIGQKNFNTLQVKARALTALNKPEEAKVIMDEAIELGTQMQVYQYGASLVQQEKNEDAMEVFQFVEKKFPENWITHVGLGAGYRVNGDPKKALKHYNLAMETAPAQWKQGIKARIDSLGQKN